MAVQGCVHRKAPLPRSFVWLQNSAARLQGFLGLPMDVVERAVADTDGDLEAAVDSLLERAERQPDQEAVTPKQNHLQLNHHRQQLPPQQNGHPPWQSTPQPPGKPTFD